MKFKLPLIEPLIISAYNGEWVHPNIELLTLNFDEQETGELCGPLIKLVVEFLDGSIFTAIALTTTEGVDDMMIEDELENYVEMMFVSLGEDVWCPGNSKPFVFTKYGELFNENYPLFTEPYRVTVSPDVSLDHDDVDWWWNT